MRRILKRRELVEDEWRYLGEDGAANPGPEGGAGSADASGRRRASAAVIVPFADFRTNVARWRAYSGPLGVRLSPADKGLKARHQTVREPTADGSGFQPSCASLVPNLGRRSCLALA